MADIEFIEHASDTQIAAFLEGYLQARLAECEGTIAISVPGGSTPFPILEALTKASIDWSRIIVWPGDDRIVSEDHPASNTGKIRALLEPVGARVVSLAEDAVLPRFAIVWLGMGTDGHIASLFPNTDPKANESAAIKRLTPDPLPPEAPFDRITLTIPSLLNSDAMMFVIRGEDKLAVFEAGAAGENDLPVARLLGSVDQKVKCFT